MKWYIAITLVYILLCSCQQDAKKQRPSHQMKNVLPTSHSKMIQLLSDLDRNANPQHNYHLNQARANFYGQQASRAQTHQQMVGLKFKQAVQLMYAAKTDESIAILNSLIKETGVSLDNIPSNLKLLFDVLGMAYLRKGELDNCVINHNSSSCIVPLQPSAYHELTFGSENAIKVFTAILEQYPKDKQIRYLLNIAYMTLGKYPFGVPAKYRLPDGAFEAPKDFPYYRNIAVELGVDVNGIAGGCIVEDFDNDGLLDIFASSYMYGHQIRFFKNDGQYGFVDETENANLSGITGGLNMQQTDYNNDGFLDVFILRGGWLGKGGNLPNSLLQNNGDGTFTDVTTNAGLLTFKPTQTACWADFNNDGWVDVFIGNESGQYSDDRTNSEITSSQSTNACQLFINQGNGTFVDDAKEWNADVEGFVKGVSTADFNNDGLMDIYISQLKGKNLLLKNEDGKSFVNVAQEAGVEKPINSFPCMFWDYNNDGWEDLFVSGYDISKMNEVGAEYLKELQGSQNLSSLPRLYKNNGDGTFEDITEDAGLDKSMYAMGLNFGDINHDGWLDFYVGTGTPNLSSIVPNRMFLNKGGNSFVEVTNAGFGHIQKGHGVGFGDFNNDGDQDIYTVMGGAYQGDYAQNALFENPGNDHNWIVVKLEGKNSNKVALGARIMLEVKMEDGSTQKIYRTVTSGASFGANPLKMDIGLGKADTIISCEIKWPGKNKAVVINKMPKNKHILIMEGNESNLEIYQHDPFQFKFTNGHEHHGTN